jgi:murein DD-endopeptidase MepM/ murein hydrolase activator NlpD
MSCCPEAPPIVVTADSPPNDGPEQALRPGETVECFSQRAGNSTGAHDDAVVVRKNTIANESVPVDCSAKVNVQFKLTTGSDATGITWAISGDATPGVTFSGDTLFGTFDSSVHGKKITITVTATFTAADSTSDSRTYSFSPSICKGDDSIQFMTPFPGASINSPYGMRYHPIQKVDKLHTGVDMIHTIKGVNHPICAAADGVVIKARNTDPNGYGNAIHIKHVNGSGQHLCTTTYNHLFKMLVEEGTKVSAGQQIALEGGAKGVPGSGGSSGLHLHFECKLPNGSYTDPVPYFRGAVQIAGNQTEAGVPASGSTTTQGPSGAAVNSADVASKTGCPSTADYPADLTKPEPGADAVPAGTSSDPFELAWYFTMTAEVGSNWSVPAGGTPSDPDIIAGACDTPAQKRKCGYVNWETASGGETKFGITKAAQPRTSIKGMPYDDAKKLGYSNYWRRGKVNPSGLPAYLGVFMFDTNFNHGDGNGNTIYKDAGVSGLTDKASQLADLEKLYKRRLAFANTLKVETIRKGVAARVTACYEYVKSLTI